MAIPKRVTERIVKHLKPYQAILQQQKARDVSEADTVTIVKDILSDIFGYDKYAELTSEHCVRGTYCDLAVKVDGKLCFLLEVKAIGLELRDAHVKQAIDYASNQGCEWVVLTNGVEWCLYHVLFRKPIDKQEVARIDLTAVSAKSAADLDRLYLLTREGLSKSALAEYRDRKDATSRFMLAAILLNSPAIISEIKRSIRRISGLNIEPDLISKMLREEVIKRETIEGEQADSAGRRVHRDKNSKRQPTKAAAPDGASAPAKPESTNVPAQAAAV